MNEQTILRSAMNSVKEAFTEMFGNKKKKKAGKIKASKQAAKRQVNEVDNIKVTDESWCEVKLDEVMAGSSGSNLNPTTTTEVSTTNNDSNPALIGNTNYNADSLASEEALMSRQETNEENVNATDINNNLPVPGEIDNNSQEERDVGVTFRSNLPWDEMLARSRIQSKQWQEE